MFVAFAVGMCLQGAELVGIFDPYDLKISSDRHFTNPWHDVRLRATLIHSSGRKLELSGFYEDAGKWVVRASFDLTGLWTVETRSDPPVAEFLTRRQVEVTPNGKSGPLRLRESDGTFVHADDTPFFLAGDTCYPLLGLDRQTQLLPYLQTRAKQGFTLIRWQAAMIEPRFANLWPWGGTKEQPDLDRFNPVYFRHMDEVIGDLRSQGLATEVILLNFYPTGGPMRDPKVWTKERERAWLEYLVSRYSAFDNVAYWTVANEFETWPEGSYRLDEPADVDWAGATAKYIKSVDPYRHPVTVHPYSGYEKYIAMFGNAPEIDLLTLQEHGAESKTSRFLTQGDGAGLEQKIQTARATGKAVIAAEFGYEWDGATQRGSNTTSDLQRRHAWRIVMGGGHFAAGFRSTVFNFPEITFDVSNGNRPGASYLSILVQFFRKQTAFWTLRPAGALRLLGPHELVIYAPSGGGVEADVSMLQGPLVSTWLNPVTGEQHDGGEFDGGAVYRFTAPWSEAVLHIKSAITVESPLDSGWPRRPDAIHRRDGNHFTIDPDGHNRFINVDIVNRSRQTQTVTLDGLINSFGRVHNRQTLSQDQYLYVALPGQPWRRTYRHGDDLVLAVPNGRTRVSTVVPFSYEEYLRFVESLHDPRVRVESVLSSGNGAYQAFRIRVTNPGGNNKLRLAINRTNHAYERSGFFIIKGVLAWLLSGDPAANLDAIEWTLYPTLDPQAIHDGQDYTEYDKLILDDGRQQRAALWDPRSGELPSARYHAIVDLHMWEVRDWESYKYNDPFAPSGPAGNGKSKVEQVLLGFWPYWYEFGIDAWDHENKWQSANALPKDFGGALVTHLELPFYGKDDIDPRDRLAEQGRRLARSHSQAFLRMQRDHHFWPDVDASTAVLLSVPETILLEQLRPQKGQAFSNTPLILDREEYTHGIVMTNNTRVTYTLPKDVDTFRAMVGIDDGAAPHSTAQFFVDLDGKEIWRSSKLQAADRKLAFLRVSGSQTLTLRVEGSESVRVGWGGSVLTRNDAELSFAERR